MIEESATVVAVGEGFAWVETQRRSSCSTCGKAASCGTSILSWLFPPTRNRLKIQDPIGLRTGERIVIGITDATLNSAALLAYMLPLLALIGASGLATALETGEGVAALAGLGGLALGLWLARLLTGGATGQARFRPSLIRREAPEHQFALADLALDDSLQSHKRFTA
ncbi:SoxR reducing system RseC family protein [Imhoffiella purpurea]|uniref:Sigma factor RpoE regulatory protein RseC n=1 Tax=Imhoffiella purpurea TaxID=1249627 RepID=W9V5M5_9GAMM|nr:SoxR reducing system RseC family protein [Imhoffiella purpurea]EXJ14813.1 Sigma factor RpoE regulatory protein RseC [Imhoffiella purpurea]